MKTFYSTPISYIVRLHMGKRVTKKSKRIFSELCKEWRQHLGLSQSQAAERLGISIDTLQNWEIARTMPGGLAFKAMMKEFGKGKTV